jgi:hypothetical protein
MTAMQLIRILVRRWYFLLVFAAITVGAVGLLSRVQGVYWTQVNVVFLPPFGVNQLEDHTDGVVQFAAVIERQLNGNRTGVAQATTSGTLYGEGVRRGWQVSLLNSGGQWGNNFNRQVLSIQVVDSSPELVGAKVQEVGDVIDRLVREQQDAQGIAAPDQITTLESPSIAPITYVAGSTTRATIGVVALGIALGVIATVGLDRLIGYGRHRRRRRWRNARSLQEPHVVRDSVDA